MPHPRKCKMRCVSFRGSKEHGVIVAYTLNEIVRGTSSTTPSSLHPNTVVSSIHWRVEGRHGSHQGALTSL